jgi:hypothetical protein
MNDRISKNIEKPNNSDSSSLRRRIPKACNYCRQRKIKCNGDSPCLNCVNHKIDCVYSKTVRKRKRQQVKKLSLQDLNKRANKLDQKFEILSNQMSKILALLENTGKKPGNVAKIRKENTSQALDSSEESEDEEEEEDASDEDDQNDQYDYEENTDVNGQNDNEYLNDPKFDMNNNNLSRAASYPISPVESTNDSERQSRNTTLMSPPISNAANQQISQDNSFNFMGQSTMAQYDLNLSGLDNTEQKLNYIYGSEPLIHLQLETEMF